MAFKVKFTPEKKLEAVLRYLNGEIAKISFEQEYGAHSISLYKWVRLYKEQGVQGLQTRAQRASYSKNLKQQIVNEYEAGGISFADIAVKYHISSHSVVERWVTKYNNNMELKSSNPGGTLMIKGRKTDIEERIRIVSYCIGSGKNYGETAEKFSVSYQQIYSWVKKYIRKGVEGLEDRRGRGGAASEPMTDIEKLKAELELEKAKNQRLQVENDFLKKLEEIERRRY